MYRTVLDVSTYNAEEKKCYVEECLCVILKHNRGATMASWIERGLEKLEKLQSKRYLWENAGDMKNAGNIFKLYCDCIPCRNRSTEWKEL